MKKRGEKKREAKCTNLRGASGVMNGAREENPPLTIDDESLAIISDIAAMCQ